MSAIVAIVAKVASTTVRTAVAIVPVGIAITAVAEVQVDAAAVARVAAVAVAGKALDAAADKALVVPAVKVVAGINIYKTLSPLRGVDK